MPSTLAVRLTAQGERHVRARHPWVYSDSIERVKGEGAAGDLAIVFDRKRDRVLGVGLYDPDSPIQIKMLHAGGGARIDSGFWRKLIDDAYARRAPLRDTDTDSYRLLHGENDGTPGLVADVYASVLVVKVYSLIWVPYLRDVYDLLIECTGATATVLRLSRLVQQHPARPENWHDGTIINGYLEEPVVLFREHGVRLGADVVSGHKTGFFLDHRENRRLVGERARGKRVLDVFSYAGGFSVHALVGGATEVTAVDISKQALSVAQRNAELNHPNPALRTIAGDAFAVMERLRRDGDSFGLVVVDPPSFAKRADEVPGAMRAYERLTRLAIPLVERGGTLLLASCSARVRADDFYALQLGILRTSGRSYDELQRVGHGIDHPVGFPEGAYLKALWVRLH